MNVYGKDRRSELVLRTKAGLTGLLSIGLLMLTTSGPAQMVQADGRGLFDLRQ